MEKNFSEQAVSTIDTAIQRAKSRLIFFIKNTVLKLYAKVLEYKTIYIDFQDGNAPVEARIYPEIGGNGFTFSINVEKDGKTFYGLSDAPDSYSRVAYYSAMTKNQTYYAVYLD